MKKIMSLLVVVTIILSLTSCKQDPQKLILGEWKNVKTDVTKLDEVTNFLYTSQKDYITGQVSSYELTMSTLDDSSKIIYQQFINELKAQLDTLTIESIKKSIERNYSIGTFIFNEDKTLVIKNEVDEVKGSWYITEDGKELKIKFEEDEIPLQITDISKSKFVILQKNNMDSIEFEISYSFEKTTK